jgi:hypothetical protein
MAGMEKITNPGTKFSSETHKGVSGFYFRGLKHNSAMYVQYMGCQNVDWGHLTQGRVQRCVTVDTVTSLRTPRNAANVASR